MMRESATFQAILHEVEALGERRGEQREKQIGIVEGETRGELKGKRQTVLRLLTRKFGNLPLDIVAKIEMLSTEQIWDMQALDDLRVLF